METQTFQLNSPAWLVFVKTSFCAAVLAMAVGIVFMPVELWVKGYLAMGTLFVVGSTFTLAKTLRDEFESRKLINRIQEARTEKILKDYDLE
ncbi:MAG TPA: YiaA/YiaB family inner membrane protein [Candidatus Competibacteraceae bacterium]|nr:YiaA/YiaB family inner membrane protein [Candidatus Competibacteraceae bacterium]